MAVLLAPGRAAAAQTGPAPPFPPALGPFEASTIEFVPSDGAALVVGDRRHGGTVRVAAHDDGLAVTETLGVDEYLLGIREVPFSWPEEALEAQVVAARTYLAWTLQRGRSAGGRRYGYDICATDACQVYAGLEAVLGPGGDRWRRAVEETADLILVHEGEPAQALYSSTTGGRTRSVEDVFPGSEPLPYLRGVESPGEQSPFARWSFEVPEQEMEAILRGAEVLSGDLVGLATEVTADGGGPWQVVVQGTEGTSRVPTWQLRTAFNRAASSLFPSRFPVRRPDGSGRRYPQVILSPTYTIRPQARLAGGPGGGRVHRSYLVEGNGWGHLVGMSQYGAAAMASRGADSAEILGHYYGGLTPQPAGPLLPDTVTVGLRVGAPDAVLRPTGPVDVVADGVVVAVQVLGTWSVADAGGSLVATPPIGLGQPPVLHGPGILSDASGTPQRLVFGLTAPAEVRLVARVGERVALDGGWMVRDAGPLAWEWADVTGGTPARERLEVTVTARSPQGEDSRRLAAVTFAE